MIVYPAYVDPQTGLACDALTVIERLAAARFAAPRAGFCRVGLWRQIRRMLRGIAWATRQPA